MAADSLVADAASGASGAELAQAMESQHRSQQS